MLAYAIPLVLIGLACAVLLYLNERNHLFATDHFSSPAAKYIAYAWLCGFMLLVGALIVNSSLHPPRPEDLAHTPFYSVFLLHAILLVFLTVWWILVGRPPLAEFFNFRTDRMGEIVMTGFAVGIAGWLLTILCAVGVALILSGAGLMPKNATPAPMIGWIASLATWKKIAIVFSAMTVEELFFRGWLQKRVGLIASTVLFALAHSGLGQPLLLIGVAVISLVIGFAFYRTKNIIPGIIAHGVFDAVQLFVIIPIAFKATGMG